MWAMAIFLVGFAKFVPLRIFQTETAFYNWI